MPSITKAAFQKIMASDKSSLEICREDLLGSVVWLFERHSRTNSEQTYLQLQSIFESKLNLKPGSVHIVGSARLGFSLSPFKNYKDFSRKSDIDLVIVSSEIFTDLWDALFKGFYNNVEYIKDEVFKSIFLRHITLDPRKRSSVSTLRDLNISINEAKRDYEALLRISVPLKYRIYQSTESLELYHVDGISRLRKGV